jgi:tellurite methyltransferase
MTEEKYFFEKKVYNQKGYKFRFKADKEILRIILNFKKAGRVLDLGCGEAGISLNLAERGFDVTCIDISQTAITAIKKEAKRRKLKMSAICEDLENFKPKEKYDIVLGMGIFHFLSKSQTLSLIDALKKKTNMGGIHIIDAFLEGDPSQEEDSEGYYFKENELKKFYFNWKIIDYEEYREGKSKLATLIAQKA